MPLVPLGTVLYQTFYLVHLFPSLLLILIFPSTYIVPSTQLLYSFLSNNTTHLQSVENSVNILFTSPSPYSHLDLSSSFSSRKPTFRTRTTEHSTHTAAFVQSLSKLQTHATPRQVLLLIKGLPSIANSAFTSISLFWSAINATKKHYFKDPVVFLKSRCWFLYTYAQQWYKFQKSIVKYEAAQRNDCPIKKYTVSRQSIV